MSGRRVQLDLYGNRIRRRQERYWLCPPELYAQLDAEFHFDCDPFPCPLPTGHDAVSIPWGRSNFCNPPFVKEDMQHGRTLLDFCKKAINESEAGKGSVLLIPVSHHVQLLVAAGAQLRPLGRVRWLDVSTGKPMPNPPQTGMFVLPGRSR